jgi:hypothetical protein
MNRHYLNKAGFNKLAQSIKDYVNRKITGYDKLGTASTKDFTTYVSPTQTEQLPISSSVYSAMTNMLRGAYHPAGSKTVAELTEDLLVKANLGNVYKITEDGTTSDLFIGGAGQTIKTGDNAIVLYASEDTYKFSLESGVVDLDAYQKKELTSGALIEDVIPTDASANNKLVTKDTLAAKTNGVPFVTGELYTSTDLNTYRTPLITFINNISGRYSNCPKKSAFLFFVKVSGNNGQNTPLSYVTQELVVYDSSEKYIRSYNPNAAAWSSWQKLVTESDLSSFVLQRNTINGSLNTTNKTVTFDLNKVTTNTNQALSDVRVELLTGNSLKGAYSICLGRYNSTWRMASQAMVAATELGTVTFSISGTNLIATYTGSAYGGKLIYSLD